MEAFIILRRTNFQMKSLELLPLIPWKISVILSLILEVEILQLLAKKMSLAVFNLILQPLIKIPKPSGCPMNRQLTVSCVKKNLEFSAESITVAVVALWFAGNAPQPKCTCMDIKIKKCECVKRVQLHVRRDRKRSKIEASLYLRELQGGMEKSWQ